MCHFVHSKWSGDNKFHIFFNVIFSWTFIFFHCWCLSLAPLLCKHETCFNWIVLSLKKNSLSELLSVSTIFWNRVVLWSFQIQLNDDNSFRLTTISLIRTNRTLTVYENRTQNRIMRWKKAVEWTNFLMIQVLSGITLHSGWLHLGLKFGPKEQSTR